jgi:hypothetical protein
VALRRQNSSSDSSIAALMSASQVTLAGPMIAL